MPDPSPEELSRIEDLLLARLTAARETLEHARADVERLEGIRCDLGLNHPDGRGAALTAARLERVAIQNYAAALRAFSEFILRGLPGNPDRRE